MRSTSICTVIKAASSSLKGKGFLFLGVRNALVGNHIIFGVKFIIHNQPVDSPENHAVKKNRNRRATCTKLTLFKNRWADWVGIRRRAAADADAGPLSSSLDLYHTFFLTQPRSRPQRLPLATGKSGRMRMVA